MASPRDDEVLGAPAQYGPVPERLQSRRGEGDARSAGAVRPHGQDPGRHGLGPEGPVGEGRHRGRQQNGRGHGRGQDGAGRPPGGRHPAPRPVGREDQTRGPQTDHGAAGARQPERPEVDDDHPPPQAPGPGEAGGPPAERLDDERRADHRVDHRIRAQETRVAERGAHSVARVAEQVDVDEVVVMRQTRRAHHGTHREVDAEEQPPVGGAPEHGTGHEREQEPVGEIEHALHAIVGGPQASGGTDAERPRDRGHEQPDGEREHRPRPGRTAPAVEERQRDPDGRRDLDDRAGVNGLADDEGGEYGRVDDQGGRQDEEDADADDPRQDETGARRGPPAREAEPGRPGNPNRAMGGGVAHPRIRPPRDCGGRPPRTRCARRRSPVSPAASPGPYARRQRR